ncbi:MAG: hypothetical protein ACKOXJ_07205, partial [Alphaproteobacteria bacterium]
MSTLTLKTPGSNQNNDAQTAENFNNDSSQIKTGNLIRKSTHPHPKKVYHDRAGANIQGKN